MTASSEEGAAMRTVADVMTRDVVPATPSTPFKELVRLLDEHRVSALPVVDEDDRPLGVVSEADLLLKEEQVAARGGVLARWRHRADRAKAQASVAAELMTSPAVTVERTATLPEAARLMHERGVKRLLVVDGEGRLVGIVSRSDLLRVFLRPDAEIREDVLRSVIEGALWLDPGAVRVEVEGGRVRLEGTIERRSLIPVVVRLVSQVDGVVGVESRLGWQVDDVSSRPEIPTPWGVYVR
ncbi:MAG TPA: CBS domain-containing protein [Actinomycetota bacterium]|nr:CBS domain-containing protein [Actinomycetota bacterium]